MLKRSCQQTKSKILVLLQGCYNIKEIAAQFLTEERYNVLITAKILILLLL